MDWRCAAGTALQLTFGLNDLNKPDGLFFQSHTWSVQNGKVASGTKSVSNALGAVPSAGTMENGTRNSTATSRGLPFFCGSYSSTSGSSGLIVPSIVPS